MFNSARKYYYCNGIKRKLQEKREKAESFLKKVGLYEKRMLMATSLSGGEAQRVSIVRALINDPKMIFCDEPTGDLNSENSRNVMALLQDMREELGCALVVVTHDKDIGSLGEKRIILKDGVINEVG